MESRDAHTCERSHVGHGGDRRGVGLGGLPGERRRNRLWVWMSSGMHIYLAGPSRIRTF